MAMVDNTAMLYKMAVLEHFSLHHMPSPPANRVSAEQRIADLFRSNKWSVEMEPGLSGDTDLIIQRGKKRFAVEIKTLSEGRPDRVLPLLSMAILQARTATEHIANARPLAIIEVPDVSPSLVKQVDKFTQRFARDVPVGLVSQNGGQYFTEATFEELNHVPEKIRRQTSHPSSQPVNLFSDLNQWMLKLLLAYELPEGLLNAPSRNFRSGAELAEAAQVSAMSASRFLQQLRSEGYLNESSPDLRLVRREELFRRWSAASMRLCPEMPCRFLLRAPIPQQLRTLLANHRDDACLGLFAAADQLNVGHVSGVTPYVYVRKLPPAGGNEWPGLHAFPSDRPDLILRQAPFPQSTFRGAVDRNGLLVSDVIQVWLDVLHHPTRGEEQANLIYGKFLSAIAGR